MSLNWNEIKIDKKSVHEFFEKIDTDALLYNIDQMLKQIDEEEYERKNEKTSKS